MIETNHLLTPVDEARLAGRSEAAVSRARRNPAHPAYRHPDGTYTDKRCDHVDTCGTCGVPIRPASADDRAALLAAGCSSGWTSVDTTPDGDPIPCTVLPVGHSPADPPPMRRWAVYDDGEAVAGDVVPGARVHTEAARLAAIGEQPGAGRTGRGRRVRYELRPYEDTPTDH